MEQILLPPHIQLAQYRAEGLPKRFHGNKLIEALPPTLSEDELYASLEFLPPFDDSSRSWDRHDRLRELLSLTNIMVPLSAHIELGRTLDSMMREGYVGRSAMSAEHMSIYHDIRADELASKYGKSFRQTYDTLTPKLSTALVGVSGMGKTTTIQRVLARYPRVIYHPEIALYQIPWLHFEMPSDGKGVKSLLIGIIEAIAELIPDNTYFEDYVVKGRPSESALQSSVRRLLNKHCVGLLIPDEVQNAANSRKSDQLVMTELTTLANKSKAPVLYIGTPKANKVLGLDLRQGRRSVGLGLGDWNPLPRYDLAYDDDGQVEKVAGEWVALMEGLWQYCWLANPVTLTEEMLDVFHDCTQGIIDLAIKLFIVAQARVIIDGVETLSEQLVRAVYEDQFKVVHPMIDAYRSGSRTALERFEDLEMPDACDVVEDMERRTRLRKGHAASTRPGHSAFTPRLTEAAKALGLPPEDAMTLAQQVADDGTAKNMLDAAVQLAKKAQPAAKGSSGGKKKGVKQSTNDSAPSYPGIEHRPDDMRNAIVAAAERGTSVIEQLLQMKMVLEPEEVLCLD